MLTPTAADLTLYLDTISSIYQQELGRDSAHFEEGHYLWAILTQGYDGNMIRAEVRAVKPPPPTWTLPTRSEVLANLKADLCMLDTEGASYPGTGTWAALSWDDATFSQWADRYKAAGHRLVPCSMVVRDYLGDDFDYAHDLPTLRTRLIRCYTHGLIPMLNLSCYDERGRGAETVRELPALLAALDDLLCAVFTGFEIEVDGGPSLYTFDEHLRVIEIVREVLGPDVVIGLEFNAHPDGRNEPIVFDGRKGHGSYDYWTATSAKLADLVLMRLPYHITTDPKLVCDEVGGALCRLQGAFIPVTHWPDGSPISPATLANWTTDYGTHKAVVLFEYASAQKWSSARKRDLRYYVQAVLPTLSGYGEG